MDPLTPDDVRRALANPFYCCTLNPALAAPHEPMVSEAEWIRVNAQQIERDGAEEWLRTLLDVLKEAPDPKLLAITEALR